MLSEEDKSSQAACRCCGKAPRFPPRAFGSDPLCNTCNRWFWKEMGRYVPPLLVTPPSWVYESAHLALTVGRTRAFFLCCLTGTPWPPNWRRRHAVMPSWLHFPLVRFDYDPDLVKRLENDHGESVVKQTCNLIAAKGIKLAEDWMRTNPGRGVPRLRVAWPDLSAGAGDLTVHIMIDEPPRGLL